MILNRQLAQVKKERPQIIILIFLTKYIWNDKDQIFAEHEQFTQRHLDKDVDKVVYIFSGNCNWTETQIHVLLKKNIIIVFKITFSDLI